LWQKMVGRNALRERKGGYTTEVVVRGGESRRWGKSRPAGDGCRQMVREGGKAPEKGE